jgi:E3 ubiquitin-protein ligase UHRF1
LFVLLGNAGLLTSCKKGFPLRVVRSHKEKRSSYAPEATTDDEGNVVGCVRYDGIYRIEKCWRKPGVDGKLVCRYLIVRCDNDPAPFSSEDVGDRPGLKIKIDELGITYTFGAGKKGTKGKVKEEIQDLYEREASVTPAWDWKAVEEAWGWTCEPPRSDRKTVERKPLSDRERLMKEFACDLSVKAKKKHVMKDPVTAPCGHKFCRACLSDAFKGVGNELDRKATSGRSLRKKKIIKCCPICKADITDTVNNLAVNNDLGAVIEKLKERCDYQSEGEEERPKEEKKSRE